MAGIVDIEQLLSAMHPKIMPEEYVFCTVSGTLADYVTLQPLATFQESEGLTLVLLKESAQHANLAFEGTYKQITLTVHSSLDAVGLTAAVAEKLASKGLSANIIAAYYHDHIFVQTHKAHKALLALQQFSL